ncbi:hypothetical protein TCAL_16464, partial [Tigriopus californicus]
MRKPSRNFEKGLPKSALNSGPHDISLRNIAHIYKDKWYELCLTITLMDRDSGKVPMFMTQCKDNVSAFDVNFEFKSRHIPDDKKSMASLDEIRHLKMRLNPKNVLDTYLYAENYGDTQMLYECLKLIDRNAQSILNSSKCSTLPLSIFKGILSRNTLAAKEVEVFESVIRWSQAEIKRRLDDEDEGEVPSLSELFKEFQPFMRFHGFTSQEFVHTVLPYGVLDIEAISKISAKIRHKEEPETFRESENTLLSPEPRTGLNQARDLLFENDEASNTLRNARVHTQNIKDQNPVQSMTRMGPGYYQCARFNPDEAFSIVNKWPDSYVLKFRADRNIYLLGACITENDRQFYKPSFHFILKLKDVSNGRVISEGTETFMRK